MMEELRKELKSVLSYFGLPAESVETFDSILLDQIAECKEEVIDYLEQF